MKSIFAVFWIGGALVGFGTGLWVEDAAIASRQPALLAPEGIVMAISAAETRGCSLVAEFVVLAEPAEVKRALQTARRYEATTVLLRTAGKVTIADAFNCNARETLPKAGDL